MWVRLVHSEEPLVLGYGSSLSVHSTWHDLGWELWSFGGDLDMAMRSHPSAVAESSQNFTSDTALSSCSSPFSNSYSGRLGPGDLLHGCVSVKTAPPEGWLMLNTSKQASK